MINLNTYIKNKTQLLVTVVLLFLCLNTSAQTIGPDGTGAVSTGAWNETTMYNRSFTVLKVLTLKSVDIHPIGWHNSSGCEGGTNNYTIELYKNNLLFQSKDVIVNCGALTTVELNFENLEVANYELRISDVELGQINVTNDYSEKSISDIIILEENLIESLNTNYSGAFYNWVVEPITGSPITLPDTIKLCPGQTHNLNYRALYSERWTGTETFNQINDSTIELTPTQSTVYYFNRPAYIPSNQNFVKNGDFENGNTDFTTEYTYSSSLSTPGELFVGPQNSSPLANVPDHTTNTSTGNMLIVNGSDQIINSGLPNNRALNVWCQTIDVIPNTEYEFDFWYLNAFNTSQFLSFLSITMNGVHQGNFKEVSNTWQNNLSGLWDSELNTNVEFCIINSKANSTGNNFLLDDISFTNPKPILEYRVQDSVVVIIETPPTIDLGDDTTICDLASNPITLDAGNNWDTFNWNNSKSTQTIDVNSQGTYSVIVSDIHGCYSSGSITVNNSEVPQVDLGNDTTVCDLASNPIVMNAGNNWDTFSWNNAATSQEITINTPGTYMVTTTNNQGCSATGSITIYEEVCRPDCISSESTFLEISNNSSTNRIIINVARNAEDNLDSENVIAIDELETDIILDITYGTAPYKVEWILPDLSNQNGTLLENVSEGNFSFTVTDDNQCTNSYSFDIINNNIIEPPIDENPKISKEDFFSPNGDGQGDLVRVTVQGESQIIDFKGNVLKTVKYRDLWDGTSQNGTLLPSGVYIVVGENGKQEISLLR